jgi:hypothetical protein
VVTDTDTFTPDNTLKGTLQVKDQQDKRVSRVQVYFGRKDPTKPLSNLDNFRSTSVTIDQASEDNYGSQAIKTITSRWIPEAGRTIADRLGAIILGRFSVPPRNVQFQLQRYAETDVETGGGYRVQSSCIQDATGARSTIPVVVTRHNPGRDKHTVEAEEMIWTAPAADTGTRHVVFDVNNYNVNLRAAHDALYPVAVSGDVVNCIIYAGVVIGSTTPNIPAFQVGPWNVGVIINVQVLGRIQGAGGRGGQGGNAGANGNPGNPGGVALSTTVPINLDVDAGAVWGGGGGGGGGGGSGTPSFGEAGGGGGGGAGQLIGPGGQGGFGHSGQANPAFGGTPTAGGAGGVGGGVSPGGIGGAGGGPGLPGAAGANAQFSLGAAGAAAGAAIDGISFVTVTEGPGDIRGAQIN